MSWELYREGNFTRRKFKIPIFPRSSTYFIQASKCCKFSVNVSFLYDKATVLGDTIKWTPCNMLPFVLRCRIFCLRLREICLVHLQEGTFIRDVGTCYQDIWRYSYEESNLKEAFVWKGFGRRNNYQIWNCDVISREGRERKNRSCLNSLHSSFSVSHLQNEFSVNTLYKGDAVLRKPFVSCTPLSDVSSNK